MSENKPEKTLSGALVEALFGKAKIDSEFDITLRELQPETKRLVLRVYDLIGPAGKEGFERMIVEVFNEARELGSYDD